MRSHNLIVLLAAVASARPVAQPDSKSLDIRELQYSEIEALYIERDRFKAREDDGHADSSHMLPHEAAWPFDGERFSHHDEHHRGEGPQRHHGHHEIEESGRPHDGGHHRGDGHHGGGHHPHGFEEFGHHPHDHHHGGPTYDILDNIVGFLAHQVRRSVPEASARVIDGIRDFLSHETRDVPHEHEHHHHPRHPHPGHDIGRHILDFFASVTR
ncbi:hypothetical protein N0V82_010883 [Gnomoniopsis sp. IMI 355080]|nr:hypothetical protein N0V82_010883 [Gnomoniopsis sp. IMI 355080]